MMFRIDEVEEEEDDDVEDDDVKHNDVEEEGRSQDQGPHFVRACAGECTSTFHKSHFRQKFTGKVPEPRTQAHILCQPAQSKCTSTFHKSHFARKFTGKMLGPSTGLYMPLHLP